GEIGLVTDSLRKSLAPPRCLEMRRSDERNEVGKPAERSFREDRHARDGRPGEERAATRRREERSVRRVEHVELEKIVRERFVEDRVLRVDPLAVHHVAITEPLAEGVGVRVSPGLQEIEMLFARTARQEVAAALELELAGCVEADRRVRAVDLLFDD